MLLGKFDKKLLPNFISIQNFNTRNLATNHIQDQHPCLRYQHHVSVVPAIGSLRFGLHVERRAEVITATASLQHSQSRHLGSQFGFALFYQQLLEFL